MPTGIEWTEETWNPIAGCTKVSPGCDNCYARTMSWRLQHNPKAPGRYAGVVEKPNGELRWTGKVNLDEDELMKPLKRKKPTTYFVCSMSDLFHPKVPSEFILDVLIRCGEAEQHTFQILTKRPRRMYKWWAHYVNKASFPPNVWLGVTAENQKCADERVPVLLSIPAVVRFVSLEPLLGAIDLRHLQTDEVEIDALTGDHGVYRPLAGRSDARLDWVIAGGESGPGARPMYPDWVRSLRDQCVEANVPFFFKQGSAANWDNHKDFESFPVDLQIRQFP